MKGDRAAALLYKDNKILLIQRIKAGNEVFVLPGGHVEENESIKSALIRELKEETSLETKILDEVYVFTDKGGRTHHIYLCEYISGIPKLAVDSSEAMGTDGNIYTPLWIDVDKIPSIPMWPDEIKSFLLNYLKK